ncbi:MAG TPA: amino acid permease [Chitinophagaceae bacterium]|jgi:APA family basic amino acid/polyamine antiporter|nr:amino acid permease [Chitinophagaceae bacterium]OPZ18941.1 MAG: Serine/threonine exchanger SteT [Bacteroidetes bacterium ADurb.BinA245]HMW66917.1 amino acid permease [Chitinophagaceae bacterium]HMX77778.1 amino acid permease [Chitinophagaceae bacterium]HNA19499.1 amino acid permease [Chitinophagaceae bacterium]
MAEQQNGFKQSLGLVDATMLVAGSMIGSGIFIVSADITRNVGSAGWLIAVWLITGFMTITAAVSYGELSGMYPKAGGQYVYLKEAFNPLAGFLYGWSFFAVIQTATIAAVGVAFARYTAYLIPAVGEDNIIWGIQKGVNEAGKATYSFSISAAQLLSMAVIIFLTYTNSKGIKGGKLIQTTFTTTKLLALFGLIVLGFLLANHSYWTENWQTGFEATHLQKDGSWLGIGGTALIGAIAASMAGSIFSSDAWNNVTFIAGEIKNPKKNIGLALFFGTLIVTIIYVCANLMYINVLPLQGIAHAQNDRVAAVAAESLFGANLGPYIIAVLIMISTFGCNNGLILAGGRVYYTMAKDGLFFKKTGELNKNAVPEWAMWAQCIVACLLCLSGRYGDLLDMISFVVVLFYALTIAGIFILRKKRPDIERPYKAFGYPVLPAIYIILAITFCVFLIIMKPTYAGIGLAIVLAGIPLYYIALSRRKSQNL